MSKQQIGVVGMAVMGCNLALNIESRGYTVPVFNRSRDKTEEVIVENLGKKLVPHFKKIADDYPQALCDVVSYAMQNGIPIPTFSAVIPCYGSYRCLPT